ncbi:MAG: hypothetical protein M1819_007223 [Sarea resinae]|nr:MAG: hypothetical protein M1819_007223 [Sarea resinae]
MARKRDRKARGERGLGKWPGTSPEPIPSAIGSRTRSKLDMTRDKSVTMTQADVPSIGSRTLVNGMQGMQLPEKGVDGSFTSKRRRHQDSEDTAMDMGPDVWQPNPQAMMFQPASLAADPSAMQLQSQQPSAWTQPYQPGSESKPFGGCDWHINEVFRSYQNIFPPFTASALRVPPQPFPPGRMPSPPQRRKKPLPQPEPTKSYLSKAAQPSFRLTYPRTLLIVLDLNGTLVHRPNRKQPHKFIARPLVPEFLAYLLDTFKVMIWSSARPENVRLMCEKLFAPPDRAQLVQVWGRDKLDLTAKEYKNKVQVYKRLEKVWYDAEISSYHPSASSSETASTGDKKGKETLWNQSNTVLIDDTTLKAASQPYNLLEIPEFSNRPGQMDSNLLSEVMAYLEGLRWQSDVSAFMREHPFVAQGVGQGGAQGAAPSNARSENDNDNDNANDSDSDSDSDGGVMVE